jgi:predicted Zn-dependent protease
MNSQSVAARIPGTICMLAVTTALASCAVNPVTGERELALISESQEVAMGQDAAEQVRTSIGYVEDDGLQSYVAAVGQKLAATSERPDLPWEFHVVDDPTPNAFALPGGYIFVTRGLMTLLGSEAELAAVLGHEIGHVTARHSVNQLSRAQLAQLGLGVGAIAAPEKFEQLGDLAGTGLGLLFLKHGRDDERQADELGFQYMLMHDYDVNEMEDVFAALEAASSLAGSSPVPTWLATHPGGAERIEALSERVASLGSGSTGNMTNTAAYLRQVEGLAYGQDPRNGYFDGDTFYHPELEFELDLPAMWQRQNTASSLIAASPRGDAAMQLSLAPQSDLTAAARAVLSQPNIVDNGTMETRINGNAALVSRLSAQTQSGSVDAIATHIQYGGRIYRILFYAPSAVFDSYLPRAEEITSSFARVDDPAVLNVRVPRLHIVDIDQAMSVREFSRRFPSVVPIEEVALVNQVQGPESSLTAGMGAKQITG